MRYYKHNNFKIPKKYLMWHGMEMTQDIWVDSLMEVEEKEGSFNEKVKKFGEIQLEEQKKYNF